MPSRIKGHAKVGGPEWFVHSREVEAHLIECFNKVVSWFDSQVSHPAQPEVHSFGSPVSILIEEKIISTDESTKSFFVGRYTRIIH